MSCAADTSAPAQVEIKQHQSPIDTEAQACYYIARFVLPRRCKYRATGDVAQAVRAKAS